MKYSINVDKLLSYGELNLWDGWAKEGRENYLQLGFTVEDIPALLQLALDEKLFWDEKEPLHSAPYHAWRVLGLLKAEQAILPLLEAINEYDDWSSEEVPKILGVMGEKSIEPIQNYLANPTISEDLKDVLPDAFLKIVDNYPECRERCVAILTDYLAQIKKKNSTLAGLMIATLIDLEARGSIETIRAAFLRGCIDISISGDLEEVEIEMGFRTRRATPKPNYRAEYFPQPAQVIKVGRNDPCPCGSGKKYKKCCLH